MARTVAGIFPDRRSAEHAIVDLKADGFDPQRMGIVMQDRSDANEIAEDQSISSAAGAVTGGVIGGTAGALLAATGALAIPGIGPFITGGVLASLVGGTAGWLVGGLAGLGLSRDEAQYYQDRVEQGGILVTVDPEGRDAEAQRIMFDNGAEDIQAQGGSRSASTCVADTLPSPYTQDAQALDGATRADPDAMADTQRGMSREMLGGTLPNIPPDKTRIPRQGSASKVAENDQPPRTLGQRIVHDEQPATSHSEPRQTVMRRPAMDEDIIQGRTHGAVGDKDVAPDERDEGRSASHVETEDVREQHMSDE